MIYAKLFDEATALRIGHAFQPASDWCLRVPPIAVLCAKLDPVKPSAIPSHKSLVTSPRR